MSHIAIITFFGNVSSNYVIISTTNAIFANWNLCKILTIYKSQKEEEKYFVINHFEFKQRLITILKKNIVKLNWQKISHFFRLLFSVLKKSSNWKDNCYVNTFSRHFSRFLIFDQKKIVKLKGHVCDVAEM